ncbi:hypothetical protein JCM8097_006103 [Rhodosporidiobolus ruineniae]
MAETTESKPTTAAETPAPANDAPKSPSPPHADTPTSSDEPQPPQETPAAQSDDALAPADPPTDPKVAQLRALFADTDEVIIEAVLASNGGNVDQAIQTLLEVNDPDFKPDNPEELSQLELDEQLARELAREDELIQAQHRVNAPQRSASLPQQQEQPIQPVSYKAYVPKSRRTTGRPASPSLGSWAPPADQPRGQQQQQQQGQERDELDELSEQFSKFAQQGRSMFGKFVSQAVQKGKEGIAKVDEAIQRSASPSSSQQPPAPPPKADYAAASYAAPTSTASWQMPSPVRSGSASYRTESPLPDFSEKPRAERSQSPSPSVPASSSAVPFSSSPAPASSSAAASPAKPAFSIPGLLPRQSFSLLDQQPGSKSKDGASSSTVKSPLSAPSGAEELGKKEDAKAAVEKKHSPGEEKSHYSLGDDDSEDDMEYVKSPFDDD